MTVDITLMRRNWRIVQRFWLEIDEWPQSDVDAAGQSIRDAVESNNDAAIECWSMYLIEIIERIRLSPGVIDSLLKKE